MYVPIILGTAREGRFSEKVADFMLSQAKGAGLDSEIVDVRDYRIKATDDTGEGPQAEKLADIVGKADVMVIVCPEYNHSFPGELKMMLDLLYKEYADKKVGICGVSRGPFGGVRGIEQLKLLVSNLHMQVIGEMYFSGVRELFDDKGEPRDKEAWERRAGRFLDGLAGKG